jgi:hypothetical protein
LLVEIVDFHGRIEATDVLHANPGVLDAEGVSGGGARYLLGGCGRDYEEERAGEDGEDSGGAPKKAQGITQYRACPTLYPAQAMIDGLREKGQSSLLSPAGSTPLRRGFIRRD